MDIKIISSCFIYNKQYAIGIDDNEQLYYSVVGNNEIKWISFHTDIKNLDGAKLYLENLNNSK